MFRSRLLPRAGKSLGPSLRTTLNARRSLHVVPQLSHDFAENGVPKFMTKEGFAYAWSDNMTFLLEKLNALTVGTDLEGKDIKTTLLMTAREPSQAPIFNYASMAHNNHFFFKCLAPGGTAMPTFFRNELEASFSSTETLRREFIFTASAMFGPGFVWLVKVSGGDYRVLATYLAGSPYPGAHWRAQPVDMNVVGNEGTANAYLKKEIKEKKRSPELPPGGIELEPLLCLNTWEHAWLCDWGHGARGEGGKIPYVEAWWNVIDWEGVARNSSTNRATFKGIEPVA
ncbi:hypothetical protein E4U55_003920 [Claviceps digitariae]|nr:hypothetical protein E4U55_003920 [Claviceps digitariae]